MANSTTGVFSPAGVTFPAFLGPMIASYRAWRAERRRQDQIAFELSCYSDRELADLNISRADIPAIAAGTYTA